MRHTKIFRKGLAVLLVFAMVVGILPGNRIAVNAEEGPEDQNTVDISQGSIEIISSTQYIQGDNEYTFDKDSLVITGKAEYARYVKVANTVNENVTITIQGLELIDSENYTIESQTNCELTIKVEGNNYVQNTKAANKAAIYSKGNLKITGTGKLEIYTINSVGGIQAQNMDIETNALDVDAGTFGISATSGVAISANTVALKSGTGNSVYVKSGDIAISANTVALKSSTGNSVYAQSGDIAISANTLAVTSNATPNYSNNIIGAVYAKSGDVSISGTERVTIDASSSIGIYAAQGDVSINNTGDFTLNAEDDGIFSYKGSIGISANMVEVTSQSGKAVFAGEYDGNIAISANNVSLTSMNSAVCADGAVSLSGKEILVERKGEKNTNTFDIAAIQASKDLTLSDTIKQFTVSSNGAGIQCQGTIDAKAKNIQIKTANEGIKQDSSDSLLDIKDSNVEIISNDYGIYSNGSVTIATAKDVDITAQKNNGIYCNDNSRTNKNISVTANNLTISATTGTGIYLDKGVVNIATNKTNVSSGDKGINIGGSEGKLTINGGVTTISARGCGICANGGNVNIATDTETNISSTSDIGINTGKNGKLTIDGGVTTIKGAYNESSDLLKKSIFAGTITVSPNTGKAVTVEIGTHENSDKTIIVDQETGSKSVDSTNLEGNSYFKAYPVKIKKQVEITGAIAVTSNFVYNGTPQSCGYKGDLTIKIKDSEETVNDMDKDKLVKSYIGKDGTSYNSTTPPTDAGKYALRISVPSTNENYKGYLDIPFTIEKKAVTANEIKTITITKGDTPHFELQYEGLVEGDTINPDGSSTLEFEYEAGADEWKNVDETVFNKTGTYKIRCKKTDDVTFNDAKNYTINWAAEEFIYGTLTVKPAPAPIIPSPSPIPSTPTENYNIPVKNENTVQIGAEIKEGKAEVSEITADTIGKVVNNKEESKVNTITIDLSGAKQEVKGVTLSKKSVEALAKATAEESNGIETATIELSKATVVLDNKTLETLVEQAKGTQIELVVADTKQEILNSAQKTTLNKYQVATTFEAYFTSDGERIHDFKGGKAVVSIAFTPEEGKDTSYYHLVYLADDGAITRYRTRYESGKLMFTTTHFSDYAVIYDTGEKNDTGEEPEEEDKTDDGTGEEPKEEDKTDGTGEEPKEEDKTDGAGEEPKEEDKTDTAEKDDGSSTEIKITMDTTYQKLRLRIPTSTKTTNVLKWVRMEEADGYVIYGSKCNTRDETHKMVQKTVIKNGKTTTWTDKNLKKDTYYKYYIKAYKLVKGKKVWLAKSKVAHSTTTGGKYGNASSVKVNKTSVSLKVGKISKIKAEQVVKNLLFKVHTQISFESSNSKVAAVTSGGVIKAKKKGTCYIYVYAQNGIYKRIKVTVK